MERVKLYKVKTKDSKNSTKTHMFFSDSKVDISGRFRNKLVTIIKEQPLVDVELNSLELTLLLTWISLMLKSGMSLADSLKKTTGCENDKVSAVADYMHILIEKGYSFSFIIDSFPKVFDLHCVAIAKSADVTGKLFDALEKMHELIKKKSLFKEKIRNAAIYPLMLSLGMFSLVMFMAIYIIPNMKNSLNIEYEELPTISKAVFAFSDFVIEEPMRICLFFATVFIALYKARNKFVNLLKKVGFIRKMIVSQDLAIGFYVIYILVNSNVSIIEALSCVKGTSSLKEVDTWFEDAEKSFSVGGLVKMNPKVVPSFVVMMLNAGVSSGGLSSSLKEIFHFLEKRVNDTANNIISSITPVFIMLASLILGTIILSIMIPMTKVNF